MESVGGALGREVVVGGEPAGGDADDFLAHPGGEAGCGGVGEGLVDEGLFADFDGGKAAG